MSAIQSRCLLVAARPEREVGPEHFRIETQTLGEPGEGQILVRVNYLMMIPSLRMRLTSGGLGGVPKPLGSQMDGAGLAEVIASRDADYPVGTLLSGGFGWREYAVLHASAVPNLRKVTRHSGLGDNLLLHVLGSNGVTAWIGLFDHGRPRIGDVLVVSAAAGSVGATVCQLGKAAGCRVIGVAGGAEKGDWLRSIGCDEVVDYRAEDVQARLKALAPGGLDIVFDNVGGDILDAMLANLANGARVVLCGATSQYDRVDAWRGPANYFQIVYKRAVMSGFYVHDHLDRFDGVIERLASLIRDGALKYREEILPGLENAPVALANSVSGRGGGLQLVRVHADAQ
jgi:NADPH-dependent curcumin reductase CurA